MVRVTGRLAGVWRYIRAAFGMGRAGPQVMLWVDQDNGRWVEYRLLDDGMFELVAVGELPVPRRWKGSVG